MAKKRDRLWIMIKKGDKTMVIQSPIKRKSKFTLVINNQYTNAPNTTQIASGAGGSSAAGSNAAIDSSNTTQQQSVGAGGKAKNIAMKGKKSKPSKARARNGKQPFSREVHIVFNHQIAKRPKGSNGSAISSATQVASGGGKYSASGTNAAIESSHTKQQHAVGGGGGSRSTNKMVNDKKDRAKRRNKKSVHNL